MMQAVTLAVLVQTWLKDRGLPWRFDTETSRLLMNNNDPLNVWIRVEKDRVVYWPTTFMATPRERFIPASDPQFFTKLESALYREARCSHSGRCVVLLYDALDKVWGPVLIVVAPWIIDRLDEFCTWVERQARKLRKT